MKFEQLRPEGSDCTAPYRVTNYRSKTIGEFIQEIIKDRPNEWGSINLQKKDCPWYTSTYRVEYKWGKIISDNIPSYLKSLELPDSLEAYGGWSNMDYNIPIPD